MNTYMLIAASAVQTNTFSNWLDTMSVQIYLQVQFVRFAATYVANRHWYDSFGTRFC